MTKALTIVVSMVVTALFGIQQARGVVAPGVQFNGGSAAGLNVPLSSDIQPVTYGSIFSSSQGQWDHDTGRAVPNHDQADINYRTTLTGGSTATSMSTDEDWVARVNWTRDDQGEASHRVLILDNVLGVDLFKFDAQGTGNVRIYNGTGVVQDYGDYPVAAGDHKLTLHFKSASNEFDFWIDDTLEFTVTPANGAEVRLMKMRDINGSGGGPNRDTFFNAQIGQLNIVPEPSTLTIFGLGGLIMWSRRRFNRA